MMETIQLKGIIEFDDDDGSRIYLIEGDTKINLVDEFESAASGHGSEVQVNYWITDSPRTKEEMLEAWMNKVFGHIEAEYEHVYMGSWTYGPQTGMEYEYRGRIKIGGHDLFDEISGEHGNYIIIELNFKDEFE